MLTGQTIAFIEKVNAVSSETALVSLFEKFLSHLGVSQYFVGEVRGVLSQDILRCGNWNAEWIERYVEKDYHEKDPVILKALNQPGGFYWSSQDGNTELNPEAKRILNEGSEFGLSSGYAVPVFQANGYLAIASFRSEERGTNERVQVALELATVYFHAKLLSFHARPLEEPSPLSDRQRECLHWVASGKTDWEIGEILNIAETTVHWHIEKAKRHYDVPTRIQAVMSAVRSRELRL